MRLLRAISLAVALGCAGSNATRAQDAPSREALQTARELAAVLMAATIDDRVAKATGEAWPALEAELRARLPAIDDAAVAAQRREFERLHYIAIADGLDETAAAFAPRPPMPPW